MRIRYAAGVLAMASLTLVVRPEAAQIAITGSRTPPPAPATAAPAPSPANPAASPSGGNPDTMLADVAERQKFAVGVVVYVLPGEGAQLIGTAWAFEPNLFATNAHVVREMEKIAKVSSQIPFYVAINQRPDRRLRVASYRTHPDYGKVQIRFDGRASGSGFDIGIIRTAEAAPATFKLASRAELQALRSGSRVAFLGFPGEALQGDNLDTQMPIATMQSGIVTSVSDAFMGDGGFDNNRLIRHNLPATGGASGSPIFTPDGSVVAILFGGNVQLMAVPTEKGVVIQRTPNAAQVNFAERIDGLAGVPRP